MGCRRLGPSPAHYTGTRLKTIAEESLVINILAPPPIFLSPCLGQHADFSLWDLSFSSTCRGITSLNQEYAPTTLSIVRWSISRAEMTVCICLLFSFLADADVYQSVPPSASFQVFLSQPRTSAAKKEQLASYGLASCSGYLF